MRVSTPVPSPKSSPSLVGAEPHTLQRTTTHPCSRPTHPKRGGTKLSALSSERSASLDTFFDVPERKSVPVKRSRALATIAAALIAVPALSACGGSDDEARIAEPVLDFPQTSTTATPTPTTTTSEEDDETTTSSSTTTKSSSSSSSKTSTTTKSSTKSSSSRRSSSGSGNSGGSAREPEVAPAPDEPGAACAWPAQGSQGASDEYSTFCDREWARTVTPDGQDYYWVARGNGWASVDPQNTADGVCWSRGDFEGAPEAIRNAVKFCDDAAPTSADVVETPTEQ